MINIYVTDPNGTAVSLTITGDAITVAEEEKTEEPEEKKPEPKPKKKIDVGKIGALRRAGWKPKDIADEMGINYTTVLKYVHEIEEKGD